MSSGKVCPQCGTRYDAEHRFCTRDGATLVAESPNDSLIGAIIADRYHILEKLGEGGMGEVYLAEHVRIKRKVAVKVMRRWMAADAVALGRFHREAENASQISHANVATIYDFGETGDGMVYFAMEYVDGEPLSSVLSRESRVGIVRGTDIVRQTADALAAAHALGILHRDLKPDNVMLGKTRVGTDHVKIVDFGISRVMHRGTQQLTSTGMVIGTPDYMSPEQLSGDAMDARTDIYALALIAFRILTGHAAFPGSNAQESLLARLTKPANRLADACPDVAWPAAMQGVFDRALSADPETRFGDALEFSAALDAATAGITLTADDERYLQLLMQRTTTPPRGYGAIDAMTPPHGTHQIPETGSTVPRQRAWAETPSTPTPTFSSGTVSSPSVAASTPEVPARPEDAAPSSAASTAPAVARRVSTRGIAIGSVALVGIVLAIARFRGGAGAVAPTTPDTATAPPPATVQTPLPPPPATTPDTSAAPAGPIASTLRSDAIVARFGRSVFDVSSAVGHAAGFLADTTGLVITSAHLVGRDSAVSVQIDATTACAHRCWWLTAVWPLPRCLRAPAVVAHRSCCPPTLLAPPPVTRWWQSGLPKRRDASGAG
ncbi:MAG: serine/threonine-protein kinase [Gemmatimonadaceae bacterium]